MPALPVRGLGRRRGDRLAAGAGAGRAAHVLTSLDAELAHRVTEVLDRLGVPGGAHPVQALEIAVDALDIRAVRPFWAAVLALVLHPGTTVR